VRRVDAGPCFAGEQFLAQRVPVLPAGRYEQAAPEEDGEARLIQEAVPEEISDHDVVFLCERGELASNVAAACGPTTVVIDLVDGLPPRFEPRLVHPAIESDEPKTPHGYYSVPHKLSLIATDLLHTLDRELGVREVVGTILRPAADHGREGLEELRAQTANILNFAEMPTKVFGAQLAFNVLGCSAESDADALAERVADETGRLLGWTDRRMTLSLLTVPVFHGHCLRFRIRFAEPVSPERVREVVSTARFIDAPEDDPPSTPVDVSADRRLVLHDVRSDGIGGIWISAVAGGSGSSAAEDAVRLAERVVGL